MGIGPDDLRKSRLIAGSAVARLDNKTAVAFGFAEGAKAMERRLTGAQAGSFLIANDIAGNPGFSRQAQRQRRGSPPFRQRPASRSPARPATSGRTYKTSATGSPYRYTSVAVDRSFGRNWLSLGISRLEEKQSLLGGRMSNVLGGGGATSLFLDAEARHDFGGGWSATLTARRGWTDFAGGQVPDRRLWLRPRQARRAVEPRFARPAHRAAATGRAWRLRDVAADFLRLCDRTATDTLSRLLAYARAGARSMPS